MFPSAIVALLLLSLGISYSAAQPIAAANRPAYSSVPWSAAQAVSGGNGELFPDLAMNAGEAQINFKNGSNQETYESYSSDNGHSWAAPGYEGCDNGSGNGSSTPSIAEDSQRNVYMVWEDYCGTTRQLYLKKYDAASSQWLATRQIVASNSNGGSVAVGPNGIVHVSYINVFTSGSSGRLEYIYSTDGGNSFSAPTILTDNATWINSSRIAVDTLSRPHIICDKGPSNNYHIIAEDFVSGAWQATTLYTGRGFWPQIAANHSGGVGAVWQINTTTNDEILYSRWSNATQQWDSTPTQVSVDNSSNFYPTLTYDNLDDAYVVWGQGSAASQQLQFSYEYSIGTWSPEYTIQSTRTSVPELANFDNNLVVAYQYDGTGNWGIWSSWAQLPQSTPTPTNTPAPTFTPQPTVCANPFVDIYSNIFFHAINTLYCQGDINGTDASHFSPAGTATRGQFAKVVVLGFGLPSYTPAGGGQDFNDVPPAYFAYNFIESGYNAGILNGFDANTCAAHGVAYPCYLPNLPITRGQITKLVVGAANYALITPAGGNPTFSDVPPSNVFFVSIETAHAHGVINGYPDGTFQPNNNVRRDEMAQIVYKGITSP